MSSLFFIGSLLRNFTYNTLLNVQIVSKDFIDRFRSFAYPEKLSILEVCRELLRGEQI